MLEFMSQRAAQAARSSLNLKGVISEFALQSGKIGFFLGAQALDQTIKISVFPIFYSQIFQLPIF